MTFLRVPAFLIAVAIVATAAARGAERGPASLPRSTPEAQGVSSAKIEQFVTAAEQKFDALHSIMIVRHGNVIAEGWWAPYAPHEPHQLNSLMKPFLSTGIGIAVAEGRLRLDDSVATLFPDALPQQLSEQLKAMRVRDLITGSTGQSEETIKTIHGRDSREFVRSFFAAPVTYQPGTHFAYNPPASLMLSAVVEKATGKNLREYLEPRLFTPLGIQPLWTMDPLALPHAVRTEDLAKLGLLYLQHGEWNGTQILPERWVEAATRAQVPTAIWVQANMREGWPDWEMGYGFQFWPCRHGIYRGDGAGGQYMLVMPEQDAVIAITASLKNMQAVLDLVWDGLVPAFQSAQLPADSVSQQRLSRKLEGLTLPTPMGSKTSRSVKLPTRSYSFDENPDRIESLKLERASSKGDVAIVIRLAGNDQRIPTGHGAWRRGQLTTPSESRSIAAAGAWTADNTYTFNVCAYHTVHCGSYRLRFTSDEVRVERKTDVLNGKGIMPIAANPLELIGKAH